ncbi:MAG: 30S ribosomal protein S12 methylthiotransferase RimO [Candidatus Gracilibacteria bacterium]|jgi:ribosomal protein S12 methylthiotransferase|nr:30S ribosomal protein S12 methylthiotransferase RimO [Candidatus Gracilibacteria bacterium]
MKDIKISIICLGCPKNLADMEYLMSKTKKSILVNEDESEIVVLNTCGFLKSARDEVFYHIERLKDKKIIVIGCLSSWFDEKIRKKYPNIFAVLSSANYEKFEETILEVANEKRNFLINEEPEIFGEYKGKKLLSSSPFAYIKIAEGCNNKCGYCLIPYLKGKYRSRKMEEIITEAKDLIKKGIKEIILVAQDCGYYGIDLYKKKSLSVLLQKLEKIPGDFWIRILYTYPERVDEELINTIKNSKKICKYMDIPLQHGDPSTLKSMKRPDNTKKSVKLIETLRKEIPEISIRTSFIVGYPGESEKAFLTLKKYIEKLRLNLVGVFEYSREPHTFAYDLDNQIKSAIKKSRRNSLMKIQQKISLENNQKLIGKREKILIEGFDKEQNMYTGRSQRFAPEIDGIIFIKSAKVLRIGTFINAKITEANEYDLYAKAISKN